MASKQEIEAALQAARAAGNAEDVAVLERALVQENQPGRLETFVRNADDAATFGFADEMLGAANWVRERGRKGSYTEGRDEVRRLREQATTQHPGAAMAGQATGALVTGAMVPGAGAPRAASLVTRLSRAVPAGAAFGAAYGAGQAPELADVPREALQGAAAGAIAGGTVEGGLSAAKLAARGTRKALALKARLVRAAADFMDMPRVAGAAGKVEGWALPSPGLTNSKARALARQAEESGGFTYDVKKGEFPQSGFAFSADPGNEQVVAKLTPRALRDYANEVAPQLKDPQARLGGWKGDDGWYLDVSRVVPKEEDALAQAANAGQKAIFDLKNMVEVPVPNPKPKVKGSALQRRMRRRTSSRTAYAAEKATQE